LRVARDPGTEMHEGGIDLAINLEPIVVAKVRWCPADKIACARRSVPIGITITLHQPDRGQPLDSDGTWA